VDDHWQVYLPVMAGSFALMVPAILHAREPGRMKILFVGAIALLLLVQAAMPWLAGGVWSMGLFLLGFFTAFNVLEAHLPTLVSRIAPARSRGVAIGVFASLQFLGTFFGAAGGGYLYERWGTAAIVIFDAILIVIWLAASIGTRIPATGGQRSA
jgi:predicted MFS family arabinose efflux permease